MIKPFANEEIFINLPLGAITIGAIVKLLKLPRPKGSLVEKLKRVDYGGAIALTIGLVLVLSWLHGLFSRWRKDFAVDRNRHSKRFYAAWNEVPAVLMIAIVILVVVKPF